MAGDEGAVKNGAQVKVPALIGSLLKAVVKRHVKKGQQPFGLLQIGA